MENGEKEKEMEKLFPLFGYKQISLEHIIKSWKIWKMLNSIYLGCKVYKLKVLYDYFLYQLKQTFCVGNLSNYISDSYYIWLKAFLYFKK